MEKYTYIAIATGLLILVIISSISHHSLIQIKEDFDWAVHTREVMLNRSYFLSYLRNAETGQLGFLLTGQEQYLQPYQCIAEDMECYFTNLRVKAAGDIVQRNRIHLLQGLVSEKLIELKKLITLQKDTGPEAARNAVITGIGKQIMNDIQALVLEMDKEEKLLLDQRAKKIDTRIKLDAVVKGTGILLILVTAILVTIRVRYWLAERRKAVKQQMDILNAKSDFISMASHELRTPFKAIRESIAIILDGSAGWVNDEQKQFLTAAVRNVDRLAKFIDNILDFQQLDSGRMKYNFRDNDINEAVEEVCELLYPSAQEKGLSLTIELDSRLPKVVFDRDRIIQVLTNIIGNAIKFTAKGDITITSAKEDNVLIVSVHDTGPGIVEEDQPKLFNKFEQLSNSKQRRAGGSGLGLAISKGIIEQHNGKIWIQSQFGCGTTVCFLLPTGEKRGLPEKQNITCKVGEISNG